MKKLYLIFLTAIAMLATSCSNDETVEMAQNGKVAIGFSSFINKSVRATNITIDNLSSIEVYGWRGESQIFNQQEVNVSSDGKGTYSPIQYWEPNYTYAFEAIAPKNGEKGVSFAAAKDGGKITFESNAETDLLYAKVADKTTGNKIESDPGAVNFTFGHMLSRVKFTFKNGFPENAAAKISVKDVKITNAIKKGAITPNVNPKPTKWEAVGGDALEVAFKSDNVSELPANTGSAETDHMYLIPVDSKEYEVKFTVTLDQNGATTEYSHTATIPTTIGMEIGKSYNFVATISQENITEDELFPIEFTAEVTNWEELTDQEISLQ